MSTCPNSYTDNCPEHSKISTAEVRHWIGEQKWESDQRDKKVARDDFPWYCNTDLKIKGIIEQDVCF